jgi:hypothetical protein
MKRLSPTSHYQKENIMRLNIGVTGGGKAFCKYSSKADRWFLHRADGQDIEVERPTFVIDFDNIATGWLLFREGQPPQQRMDPSIDRPGPDPADGSKRGFVVMICSDKYFGGTVEFTSTSIHMANAVNKVHDDYVAGKSANVGKLPVIACIGSQVMKDRKGVNYRPTFEIVQWVDRPAKLPNVSPVSAADIYQGQSSASGSVNGSGRPATPPEPRRTQDPSEEPLF